MTIIEGQRKKGLSGNPLTLQLFFTVSPRIPNQFRHDSRTVGVVVKTSEMPQFCYLWQNAMHQDNQLMWCDGQKDGLGLKRPGFESPLCPGNSLELLKPFLTYPTYLENPFRVTISWRAHMINIAVHKETTLILNAQDQREWVTGYLRFHLRLCDK